MCTDLTAGVTLGNARLCLNTMIGAPTGTRTPIDRLGGNCSILLSYRRVVECYCKKKV